MPLTFWQSKNAFLEIIKFRFKASRKAKLHNFPMAPAIVAPTRNTYINLLFFQPAIFSDMPRTVVNKRNPEIPHK